MCVCVYGCVCVGGYQCFVLAAASDSGVAGAYPDIIFIQLHINEGERLCKWHLPLLTDFYAVIELEGEERWREAG